MKIDSKEKERMKIVMEKSNMARKIRRLIFKQDSSQDPLLGFTVLKPNNKIGRDRIALHNRLDQQEKERNKEKERKEDH